jgi:hypothetical protein
LGHGGWGMGDWAQPPIPNPQSPIPNPHFNLKIMNFYKFKYFKNLKNNNLKIIKQKLLVIKKLFSNSIYYIYLNII